jgi:hypothetical protein
MKMIPDDLELAKEGLKVTAEQVFAPVQEITRQLLGPAATEIGLAWGDSFRVWRLKRVTRLLRDVNEVASELGLKLKPVALRLLFPLLEAASLEDESILFSVEIPIMADTPPFIVPVHFRLAR